METLLSSEEIATITSAATHNDLLPDSLQTTVQLIITDAERSISQLDEEIVRIQATLDDLRSQRTGHIARIQRYQTVIAPHRKLPVEMLEEIFAMCNLEPVAIPVELEKAPWMLGRVCSKWRRVVLSAPMLWSDIEMDSSAHLESGHTRMLEVLLSRSAHTPASLRIAVDYYHEINEFRMEELDDVLTSSASRLRRLCFEGPFPCVNSFLSLPLGSIGSLQTLELIGPDFSNAQETLSVVRSARNLREVTLEQVTNLSTISIRSIPFHQLTLLSIVALDEPLPAALGFDLLCQCTSLIECRLEIAAYTVPGHPHFSDWRAVVTLENLKTFQFYTTGSLENVQWLEYLSFPNLTKFYHFHYPCDSTWPSAWTAGICRSGHLESLDLNIPISSVNLEEILMATPLLCMLNIPQGMMISETLLAGMSNGARIPRLSSLRCPTDTERSLLAHLDMLESRRYGQSNVANISTAVFHVPEHGSGAAVDRVNQLINDGWNITVP